MASAPPRIAVPPLTDNRALLGLDRGARIADMGGETMGTYWKIRLAAPPECDLAHIRAEIGVCLARFVAEMSHWTPDSLLREFNQSPAGSWTSLPPDFAAVIEAALPIAERTEGAFDPAIGRLTDLHGLGPNPAVSPPDSGAIEAALGVSGWQRLAYDADARRLRQPGGLWLDLSGIAKGGAADVVADLLGEMGLRHALVEIGGECVGRGIRPDSDPWWVDLENPPGIDLPVLRIALHQLAVATSGTAVRGEHTLDPRTGRTIRSGVISASVLHVSAMHADAWATALTVLGLDEAARLAQSEGLAARMVVARDGAVHEWISPALMQMIDA